MAFEANIEVAGIKDALKTLNRIDPRLVPFVEQGLSGKVKSTPVQPIGNRLSACR